MKNPYGTLEVDPDASQEVVEAAYRALAMKNKDDEKMLKRLNAAKEVLFDPEERAKFDGKKEDLGAGKVVGDYTIVRQIAEGGFGVTYLAKHNLLGTEVCLKHASHLGKTDQELLLDEARAIFDLRHFAVPTVRDVIRMPDRSLSLVMSYIPGPTLAQIIERRKRLDAEHVSWITSRVLNALQYLHYNGVVHGDVKPQNIIIQPDSHHVVLVDYGLSAIKPRRSTVNKGYTEVFAAPEQIQGKPLVPETDLYCLGLTMIFALGGDVINRQVPEDTPDAFCTFIKRLLPLQVLSRPSWKEDLCDTFAEVREQSFGRKASNMKKLHF